MKLKRLDSLILYIYIPVIFLNLFLNIAYFTFPVDIIGVESNVIYTMQMIKEENSALYLNPSNIPYSITQYTPLYYIINDAITELFNISANDQFLIRLLARFSSALILLFSLLLLFHLLKNILKTGSIEAFFLSAAYFIFTTPWLISTRPDIILSFCYISGIILFYFYLKKGQIGYLISYSLISLIAIFSKQNGIVLAAVPILYFLIEKKYKEIIWISGFHIVFAALFTVIMISGNYINENIFANIIKGVDNGINLRWAISMAYLPFMWYFGMFFLFTLLVFLLFINKFNKVEKFLKYLILFTVFQFVFILITSLKRGSAINYYFEFMLLLSILSSILVSKFSDVNLNLKIIFKTIILITAISISGHNFNKYIRRVTSDWHNPNNPENYYLEIKSFISENLQEGEYFYAPVREIVLIYPTKSILPQYDIFFCCTFPLKTFNYENLCDDFASGRIKIIITYELLTDNYDCNLTEYYHYVKNMEGLHVYIHSKSNILTLKGNQ